MGLELEWRPTWREQVETEHFLPVGSWTLSLFMDPGVEACGLSLVLTWRKGTARERAATLHDDKVSALGRRPGQLWTRDTKSVVIGQLPDLRRASARILLWLLALYRRRTSRRRHGSCIYQPTCSSYAQEAISSHGVGRGSLLAVRRLLRCRPPNVGGADPVPGVAKVHSACGYEDTQSE